MMFYLIEASLFSLEYGCNFCKNSTQRRFTRNISTIRTLTLSNNNYLQFLFHSCTAALEIKSCAGVSVYVNVCWIAYETVDVLTLELTPIEAWNFRDVE